MVINGCQIYYTVQGQGIPILFIHPPVITHLNFECQLKELSKCFQVISFDIRGHGRSSFSESPLTYSLIAEDIVQLLDYLRIKKAFICGYSTGGTIALEFLVSRAERALGGIIVSGMSEVSDWFLRNIIGIAISIAKLKALTVLALPISLANANSKSSFWKLFKEERKGTIENMEEYFRVSLAYNCTDKLNKINCPVLLIYGEKDKVFYRYANLLHEKLPRSELIWIQEGFHQLPTKHAFELNALIKQFIFKYMQP